MRLFVAATFPEETKDKIISFSESLRKQFPQVAWTKKENIHLTLKFLGYIGEKSQEKTLEDIKKALEKTVEKERAFELAFDKVGYFEREQIIIWVGLKPNGKLLGLVNNIDREMENLGFPAEKRSYSPHVTLGRGKRLVKTDINLIKETIDQMNIKGYSPFLVSEIILMESTLTAKGPVYTPLYKFALG